MVTKILATPIKTNTSIKLLFTNHMDAWGMTFIVCLMAQIVHDAITLKHMLLTLGLVVGYWFAFGLNDYFDAPFDRLDQEKSAVNFFTHTSFSKTTIAVVSLVIACFLLALFAQFGFVGVGVLFLSLFISWAYSAPPLRLKNRPFLDLITHGLFVETFPYAVMLLLMQVSPLVLDWVILAILLCASLAAQLEQQIRDYEVDLLEGENFTIRVGVPTSERLLKGITAVLIIVFWIAIFVGVMPPYLAVYGWIGCIAMLRRFIQVKRSESLVNLTAVVGILYTIALVMWQLM